MSDQAPGTYSTEAAMANHITPTIAALEDLQAGIAQCLEHLRRNPSSLSGIAAHQPAVLACTRTLITDFAVVLDALGNAGLAVDLPCFDRLAIAIQDAWDEEFHSSWSEVAALAEVDASPQGVNDNKADVEGDLMREARAA